MGRKWGQCLCPWRLFSSLNLGGRTECVFLCATLCVWVCRGSLCVFVCVCLYVSVHVCVSISVFTCVCVLCLCLHLFVAARVCVYLRVLCISLCVSACVSQCVWCVYHCILGGTKGGKDKCLVQKMNVSHCQPDRKQFPLPVKAGSGSARQGAGL